MSNIPGIWTDYEFHFVKKMRNRQKTDNQSMYVFSNFRNKIKHINRKFGQSLFFVLFQINKHGFVQWWKILIARFIGLISFFRPYRSGSHSKCKIAVTTTVIDLKHARFSLSRLCCTHKRYIFIDIKIAILLKTQHFIFDFLFSSILQIPVN